MQIAVPLAGSLALAAAVLLTACNPGAPATDPYDVGKMDLKPIPARVSAERHKGPFAEGGSLSVGVELKPLDPSPVKTVRLDTTHKIIEIAPGVKFSAWTFGDQVPGPTIHARVGDKIRFSMASLAVAFDPRRTAFADVQKALERKLAAKKLSLLPLRVMDSPAELKTVNR